MCPAGEVGASYVYGSASRRMKKEGFKIVVMDPVQVECAEGTINAKHVLLTANAFITKLDYLKGRVFPLIGCGSLSRPLSEEEQAAMGGEATWGITGVVTMRRTLSNRIPARHGTYYNGELRLSDSRRRQILASHRRGGVTKRFPMLDTLEFDHTWAGVFCMTRDWAS